MTTHTTHHPAPEIVANLEARIEHDIARGRRLAAKLFDAHRRRLCGTLPVDTPAWVIRRELERLQEQLDLDLADLDRRRI